MERRSLLNRIFGNRDEIVPHTAETLELVEGNKATFTTYKGDFHNDPDVLACVDAIARNAAQMHPKHIRNFNGKLKTLKDNYIRYLLNNQTNCKMHTSSIIK